MSRIEIKLTGVFRRVRHYVSLVLAFLLFVPVNGYAAVFTHTAPLNKLVVHDGELFPNNDWISLDGLTEAGTCRTFNNSVIVMIDNTTAPENAERLFSYSMMARSTGSPVTISVDDTHKNTAGYCYVRTMIVH